MSEVAPQSPRYQDTWLLGDLRALQSKSALQQLVDPPATAGDNESNSTASFVVAKAVTGSPAAFWTASAASSAFIVALLVFLKSLPSWRRLFPERRVRTHNRQLCFSHAALNSCIVRQLMHGEGPSSAQDCHVTAHPSRYYKPPPVLEEIKRVLYILKDGRAYTPPDRHAETPAVAPTRTSADTHAHTPANAPAGTPAGTSAGTPAGTPAGASDESASLKQAVYVHGGPGTGKTALAEAVYDFCRKVR
jgi:hypothetical protein